jgi:hypothetical protein
MPLLPTDPFRQLAELMATYPCYAYVRDTDRADARALFRGRWRWEAVSEHLAGEATHVVVDDERASGYQRFRLYGTVDGVPGCLAEIEIYFSRGSGRTSFWCAADDAGGRLALAA